MKSPPIFSLRHFSLFLGSNGFFARREGGESRNCSAITKLLPSSTVLVWVGAGSGILLASTWHSLNSFEGNDLRGNR